MHTRYLLPHRYKKLGWLLFFPALILAIVQFTGGIEPSWLDWPVPYLFSVEFTFLNDGTQENLTGLKLVENNVADELLSLLLLSACMLLVFGRTRDEDELVMKLRLESILWAALINGLFLMFCVLFFYDFTFFYVMVANLFLLFLLFIARFHWVLYQFRKAAE